MINRGPLARAYFSAFKQRGFVGIFGGSIENDLSMGDFWILQLSNLEWKSAYFTDIPHPRHLTNFTDGEPNEKILYGGYFLPDNIYLNDVFVFDLNNMSFDPKYKDVLYIINRFKEFRLYAYQPQDKPQLLEKAMGLFIKIRDFMYLGDS